MPKIWPRRNLPGLAEKWGREVEESHDSLDRDVGNLGTSFGNYQVATGGQLEALSGQISEMVTVQNGLIAAQNDIISVQNELVETASRVSLDTLSVSLSQPTAMSIPRKWVGYIRYTTSKPRNLTFEFASFGDAQIFPTASPSPGVTTVRSIVAYSTQTPLSDYSNVTPFSPRGGRLSYRKYSDDPSIGRFEPAPVQGNYVVKLLPGSYILSFGVEMNTDVNPLSNNTFSAPAGGSLIRYQGSDPDSTITTSDIPPAI